MFVCNANAFNLTHLSPRFVFHGSFRSLVNTFQTSFTYYRMPENVPYLRRLLVINGIGEDDNDDAMKEALEKLKLEWHTVAGLVRDLVHVWLSMTTDSQ